MTFFQIMHRLLTLIGCVTCMSCVAPPKISVDSSKGLHELPHRPTQKFILSKVTPGYQIAGGVDSLDYFLNGKRKTFKITAVGDTDGYITYLGMNSGSKYEGREGPIFVEHVIKINSGEKITIAGNTVSPGKIRLH